MDKIHKAHMPEPRWYLFGVGVDPELQNRGVGSAIIREGLARADQESLPCCLETSEPPDPALYERLGFASLEQATLGTGGPPAWAIVGRRAGNGVGAPRVTSFEAPLPADDRADYCFDL